MGYEILGRAERYLVHPPEAPNERLLIIFVVETKEFQKRFNISTDFIRFSATPPLSNSSLYWAPSSYTCLHVHHLSTSIRPSIRSVLKGIVNFIRNS